MASSVSRRLTTKLLKPYQFSSSFSSSPAYSTISHSPKTLFTLDQSGLMSCLCDSSSSPARVENPIKNHDLSFFRRFYSISSPLKFNHHRRSCNLQETLKRRRPNTSKSLLLQEEENPRNPGLRFFSTPPERDLSALANETRAALEKLKRALSEASYAFVLVGLVHYSCRATMAYISPSLTEFTIHNLQGVPLAFLIALLVQRELKRMASCNEMINEMEQEGRWVLLSGKLQLYKYLNIYFVEGRKFALLLAAFHVLISGALICHQIPRTTM